ncbi:membrane fusion protein, cobalt-zinc-cadmium efflux system [Psychroflexus salarius]|uniref:Membrane fusion protein, cobalt-zinc-cadmium efflux system n=1 Tax=Psychroflexus salarius TaxID=1155689 RepID=A0A1M4SNJ7_9FLAO|nr:efflux RND transporter periplasmic adaptor subunit [Psychroflexus salarius]SHE33758.1 membrane fusion protein, cobalt-zinc-cadmium efflux system [Psychroflexus salarius]
MKPSIILLLLIFANLNSSCGDSSETSTEDKNKSDAGHITLSHQQFKSAELQLGTPEFKKFSEQFEVTGIIDVPPKNRASVTAYFDGYVTQTELLVGDEVKKGDVLVKLKHPNFIKIQQNYVEALSNLEYLKSEFDRKQSLYEDDVIAQKVFQSTKNQFLNAKAQLASAKEQIKLMNLSPAQVAQGNFTSEINILAPISGKVSKLNVAQGKFIAKSDMIMEILDVDHVHLELEVFEKDLLNINKGDTLSFMIPEVTNQKFEAYVRLIGAEISQNRRVRVHAHPINENVNFKVGMFVNASLKTNEKKIIALPEEAFTSLDDQTFILQLDEKTSNTYQFSKLKIKSSVPQNGYKPILNADELNLKAQYLTKGVFDLITNSGGGHSH